MRNFDFLFLFIIENSLLTSLFLMRYLHLASLTHLCVEGGARGSGGVSVQGDGCRQEQAAVDVCRGSSVGSLVVSVMSSP